MGGETSLAVLFRAGRHHAVLARTLDAGDGAIAGDDAPWVVGSLALLGRLDEALALAEHVGAEGAAGAPAVATRFFAAVGLLHSGRWAEARTWARRNARATRDADPIVRFFAFQGIALLRYFSGEIGRARRPARRALQEAVRAGFSFGRLLALDLGGHVLVQRGEVSAGLRVLEQAEKLAETMGADAHRAAIECARLAYRNRHGRADAEIESALSRVAATSVDNVYSRRAAWLELAFRTAIVGDAARAREALDRAREQALPDRDHRARARLSLVEAIVARLDGSMEDVRGALVEASRAVEGADDRMLRAELLAWDRALGASALDGTLADARALARRSETLVARVLVALSGGPALAPADRAETPLWSFLVGGEAPAARAESAIARGWLGLVPLVLGLAPGRWIVVFRDGIVCVDRGVVSPRAALPGHGREILAAIAIGPRAKEDLVRDVWRVPRYAPQLHDPVVHTAVARLRRAMGEAGAWIETEPSGYVLRAEVGILDVAPDRPRAGAGAGRREVLRADGREALRAERAEPAIERDPAAALLDVLEEGPLRASEIAERLGTSESTVLRRLRALIARGDVSREGVGKRTRYGRARTERG